ncbi:MAG TPA: hypothetical protein DCY74_07170, partial [Clostridiales bacterium]|nr:hypothetical protein [Clostridiales bacterium]
QDVYCRFFRDYFDAIVEGDVIVFKSFYATPPVKEDFTHQKVLNIDINQTTSTQTELNGVGYTAENFIITYNIFQNNGTFRNDLSQSRFDATGTFKAIAIEEIYSIVELNGQWKIVSVTRSKIF